MNILASNLNSLRLLPSPRRSNPPNARQIHGLLGNRESKEIVLIFVIPAEAGIQI